MPELRTDRLVSVAVVHPALRMLNRSQGGRLPILMYHGITQGAKATRAYFETRTAPEIFAAQMQFLFENGYRTAGLTEGLQLSTKSGEHEKRVVITFDDGYRDFYTTALPILLQYGFTATVFVVSGFTLTHPNRLDGEEYLSWSEIREMHLRGIEIGSHTVSHPELWRLSRRELEYQLLHSKETIEGAIGEPIRSFAHPFAFPEQNTAFTRTVSALLERHGYKQGVSTIIGTAGPHHERYYLPRLPINSHDDLNLFRAKLEGAYDWLHIVQRLYKSRVKKLLLPLRK